MLRCSDDSYYVGSTSYDEIDVRVGEHDDGRFEGYTSKRRPVTLVWSERYEDLMQAHAAERRIKGWRREKKEALIRRDWNALPDLARRPAARRPSRAASRPPQGDALLRERTRDAKTGASSCNRHPEVRAQRASKDDGGETA
ncbi:MAG: GIY-YIG nuclease family protein [Rhizomicrobium sp.]